MIRMMVRHDVADYGAWRKAYDDFDSIEAAQSFASSPRLREVMEGAGVAGAPDIWFVEKA